MNDSSGGESEAERMRRERRSERQVGTFLYRLNRDPYVESEVRRKKNLYFAEHGYGRRCSEYVPDFRVGG